jgi:predicted deacetylase
VKGKIQFFRSLFLSKKTPRKIIVIESDDWGSERIPNVQVRRKLKESGIDMDTNPHAQFDSLERVDDLLAFKDMLMQIERVKNKKVKITANFITTNPNFAKIRGSNFENYFFETFDQTYFNRDQNTEVMDLILELKESGFFKPQFHGREHINALMWLYELKRGNEKFLAAFEQQTYAIDAKNGNSNRKNLMSALEFETSAQEEFVRKSISEGHQVFKSTFGFPSKTFIPPRYVWNSSLEKSFEENGFTHIQTALFQQEPTRQSYSPVFHYTGQKSKNAKLTFMTRNVFFEPAYGGLDWVKSAMDKVDLAFSFKTPAIISTHRINFVGGLDANARDSHLKQFRALLELIITKYPEVEFLSSDELAEII